jgi:transcriptional regulator with XRE-family HTH domain
MHDMCVDARSDWPQHEFLKWLDAVRDQLGLPSDLQLSQHIGVGHTLISGWRNGRQRPSVKSLNIIAAKLGEDPRKLWVLAGLAHATDTGLLGDQPTAGVMYGMPEEMRDLMAVYRDPRMTDDDRAATRRAIAMIAAGVRSDLDARELRRSVG